jgi:hypothetical protein
MFNERNARIEAAISVFQLAVEHFKYTLNLDVSIDKQIKAYHAMLGARNELYDAIGGMEDYKYHPITEGEKE